MKYHLHHLVRSFGALHHEDVVVEAATPDEALALAMNLSPGRLSGPMKFDRQKHPELFTDQRHQEAAQ